MGSAELHETDDSHTCAPGPNNTFYVNHDNKKTPLTTVSKAGIPGTG